MGLYCSAEDDLAGATNGSYGGWGGGSVPGAVVTEHFWDGLGPGR